VRFDIPFLHKALQLPQETTAAWLFKTTDILEAARLGLFGPTHTFGLNLLCQHNQVPVKFGSGLQAIKFAQEHQWDELLRYCADDVRILCDLYRRRLLNNPRFHGVIYLRKIAPASVYLLKKGNENLALVVLLHELGHLMFRQSDIDTGMRIYSALLNDGSITKSVLLQQAVNVYRKYSVAMELSADRVMYSVMKDVPGGWDAIITVFGKLAGGVPINCEELLKQYKDGDDGVGKCLYTGVTSKDAHPPILFRFQELSDLHLGLVYHVHIVGLQDFSFAAAKANTLRDSY
jgi:hypothetical protein